MKNTTWIRIIHDEFEKFKSRTYLSKQLEEAKADFLKEIWPEWAYKLQMIKKKTWACPIGSQVQQHSFLDGHYNMNEWSSILFLKNNNNNKT